MTDVEELLRDTLADPRRTLVPAPDQRAAVWRRARLIRRRRRVAWGAAACGAIGLVAGVLVGQSAPHPNRSAPPAHRPERPPAATLTAGTPLLLPGTPADVALGADSLWALQRDPARVLRVDPATDRMLDSVAAPRGTPTGLALDSGGSVLVAWSTASGRSAVVQYRLPGLRPSPAVQLRGYVGAAVVQRGVVWLAIVDRGLFRLPVGSTTPTRVAGVVGMPFALAADPRSGRVAVALQSVSTTVELLDAVSARVTAAAAIPLGKVSLAFAGDGELWAAGYRDGDPHVLHLDAADLRVIGIPKLGRTVGPGAIVWPGRSVVWVRDGGDEGLSCLSARTGSVEQRWSADPGVQGPVTSRNGLAFAAAEIDVVRLPLAGGCTG